MPSRCSARNCTYNHENTAISGKTVHTFPFSRPEILEKWLANMQRDDWYPGRTSVLCSDHFEPDSFYKCGKIGRLKPNAVPTIFTFSSHSITNETISEEALDLDVEQIETLFPPGSKIISFVGYYDKYEATLRSKCKSKEEFLKTWLKEYQNISNVTWRVLNTKPRKGVSVVYKAAYRCEHNTYPRSHKQVKFPHKKHTGCPAVLRVTIKAPTGDRSRRLLDQLRGEYPTIIKIINDHNHIIKVDEAIGDTNITDEDSAYRAFYEWVTANGLTASNDFPEQSHNEPESCSSETSDGILVEQYVEHESETNENVIDLLSLQNRWSLLFEKWKSMDSPSLYTAALRATTYLENCLTETHTVTALNCIGKSLTNES